MIGRNILTKYPLHDGTRLPKDDGTLFTDARSKSESVRTYSRADLQRRGPRFEHPPEQVQLQSQVFPIPC